MLDGVGTWWAGAHPVCQKMGTGLAECTALECHRGRSRHSQDFERRGRSRRACRRHRCRRRYSRRHGFCLQVTGRGLTPLRVAVAPCDFGVNSAPNAVFRVVQTQVADADDERKWNQEHAEHSRNAIKVVDRCRLPACDPPSLEAGYESVEAPLREPQDHFDGQFPLSPPYCEPTPTPPPLNHD